MTTTVTLLLSAGQPDLLWTLTPEQELAFFRTLEALPVPNVSIAASSHQGCGSLMVRNGDGERWAVHHGWVRGGLVSRVDDQRVLERWLLETGRPVIDPKLMTELTRQITPPD